MSGKLVEAVKSDITGLPESLQKTGLAVTAVTLAERLDLASSRDTASIARELRATLAELHDLANDKPKEDDPIAAILRESRADLSKRS